MPPRRRIDSARTQRSAKPAAGGEPAEEPSQPPPPEPAVEETTTTIRPRGRSLRDADLLVWETTVKEAFDDPVNSVMLAHAVVQHSGPGRVELGFRNQFYVNKATVPKILALLTSAAEKAFGGSYEISVGGVDDRARSDSLTALRKAEIKRVQTGQVAELREDDSVKRVLSVFDGRIAYAVSDVELRGAGDG